MAKKTNTPNNKIKNDIDTLFKSKAIKKESSKPVQSTKTTPAATEEKKQPDIKSKLKTTKAKKADKMKKIFNAIENAKKTEGAQKIRRVTEDGFKIYTEEELGLNFTGGEIQNYVPLTATAVFEIILN